MSQAKPRTDAVQLPLPGFDAARAQWRRDYETQVPGEDRVTNRSGIDIKPLYTPADWDGEAYMADLGFPGEPVAPLGAPGRDHQAMVDQLVQDVGHHGEGNLDRLGDLPGARPRGGPAGEIRHGYERIIRFSS